MRPLLAAAAAIALAGLAPIQAARAEPAPVVRYQARVLANGLKVYAVQDPSTPYVTVQVWYEVGARDDPLGHSGLAHLCEHLMFKGARDMPPEALSRLTDDVGGFNNASTDTDYTEYHEVIPAEQLERLLWAEAERMGGLVVSPADFAAERAVVENEMRERISGDPYGPLFEYGIPEASFALAANRRSPIGTMAELERTSLDDAVAFHDRYYRPDNASLIVVGAFDPRQLDAWIDKYFGPIARPASPVTRAAAVEPGRTGPRALDIVGPDEAAPTVVLTYAAPAAASQDAPALQVIDALLTRGDAARLNIALTYRRRLADQVFSDVDERREAGLFDVGAVIKPGRSLVQGEAALRDEIARLRERPVAEAELQTAKNQLMAQTLQDRETIDGLASAIGQAVAVEGAADHVNTDLAALDAVSAADVQRVARRWLADGGRVTIRYHSGGWRGGHWRGLPIAHEGAAPGVAHVTKTAAATAAIQPPAARSAEPSPGAPAQAVSPAPVQHTLPNGLEVIAARTGDTPLATAMLVIKSGAAEDPAGKEGLAAITASLATQGAAGHTALQMAMSVQALGDGLSAETDHDSVRLRISGLSRSLPQALSILADVALRADFDPSCLRQERDLALGKLADQAADPADLADLAVGPLIFGDGPYGRSTTGRPASLDRIRRADVLAEHARDYRPGNAVLVVTGDVTPAATFALAERVFGGWTDPGPHAAPRWSHDAALRTQTLLIDAPGARQASVVLAEPTIGRLDHRYYAVEVANHILGGGYDSRMNADIRVRHGLTYDAESDVDERRGAGLFIATAQTEPASASQVARLIAGDLEGLARTPPAADELQAHKAALIGTFQRAARNSGDMADLLADDAVYGVSLAEFSRYAEAIEAVTAAQVQSAAQALADPSHMDLILVGDARRLRQGLGGEHGAIRVISADALPLIAPRLAALASAPASVLETGRSRRNVRPSSARLPD
jgi:zinc protease